MSEAHPSSYSYQSHSVEDRVVLFQKTLKVPRLDPVKKQLTKTASTVRVDQDVTGIVTHQITYKGIFLIISHLHYIQLV